MQYREVFWKMRKALMGIAAALMLTTLVVAIVPAFSVVTEYYFSDGNGTYLGVNPTNHQFWLYQMPFPGYDLCNGYGARVVNGVLMIFGRCTGLPGYPSQYPGRSLLSGGGKLTGPIVLVLTVVGRPPMVMRFIMMPIPPP